jgi:Na+/H+ antiporter NhaC
MPGSIGPLGWFGGHAMDWQVFWIFVHVVLFVYWLGADISVFITSLRVKNANYSKETRQALVKVLNFVNWFPVAANMFMLPVGLTLANGLGISPVTGVWLLLVWAAAIAWFWLIWQAGTRRGTPEGKRYSTIDLYLRYALIAVLVITGIWSLSAGGPFTANWLALKLILFAFVLCMGLGIRFSFANFGPTFGRIMAQGSTPELEKEITRLTYAVKPWVLLLWGGLVVMAYVGIAQPRL